MAKTVRALAKKAYNEKMIGKLNKPVSQKEYWKLSKQLLGNKIKPGIPTLRENNLDYTTSVEKATLLNDYFAEQCSIDAPPCALPPLRVVTQSRLHNIIVRRDEVKKILLGLQVGKVVLMALVPDS